MQAELLRQDEAAPGQFDQHRQKVRVERREVIGAGRSRGAMRDRVRPTEVVGAVEGGTGEERIRGRLGEQVADAQKQAAEQDAAEDADEPHVARPPGFGAAGHAQSPPAVGGCSDSKRRMLTQFLLAMKN